MWKPPMFQYQERMQHYTDTIHNIAGLCKTAAEAMTVPTNLEELTTYLEMQDAVIAILTNAQILMKGFLHLGNRNDPRSKAQ